MNLWTIFQYSHFVSFACDLSEIDCGWLNMHEIPLVFFKKQRAEREFFCISLFKREL